MACREQTGERIIFARKLRASQSRCEEALWRELRGRKLKGWKFRRQAPIGKYFADFCCDAAKLIVEADGRLHGSPEQRTHDRHRDAWLSARGFRVLRFHEDEILGASQLVLDRILSALEQTREL